MHWERNDTNKYLTLIILRQTWVDTEGQEEDGHTDQPQPRHPPTGDPHHHGGVLCLGDPPSAPPSAGSILVTSLWSPWSLASILSQVTSSGRQVTSRSPGRCSGCSLVSALCTGALLAAGSSLLHVSGSPGPATLTTQPPQPGPVCGHTRCVTPSHWSSQQHWGRGWPMAGPDSCSSATDVLIPVFSAARAGCDARVAAVLTVGGRWCSELIWPASDNIHHPPVVSPGPGPQDAPHPLHLLHLQPRLVGTVHSTAAVMAAPAQVVTKCQLQCHNISLSLAHHITKARNTAGPESHKPHYNSQMISRMLKAQTRSNQILSQRQMRQFDDKSWWDMNVCINDTFRLKKVLTCLKWSEMISKDMKFWGNSPWLLVSVCMHYSTLCT